MIDTLDCQAASEPQRKTICHDQKPSWPCWNMSGVERSIPVLWEKAPWKRKYFTARTVWIPPPFQAMGMFGSKWGTLELGGYHRIPDQVVRRSYIARMSLQSNRDNLSTIKDGKNILAYFLKVTVWILDLIVSGRSTMNDAAASTPFMTSVVTFKMTGIP